MTRAYLRLDPAFFERKAVKQAYPAGAALALVGCLCLAESQPERGRFRNERLLKAMLEDYGRWLPFLKEHGDLVAQPDGRLYIDGWDEWQEGDWKVGERVKRIRGRKRNDGNADSRANDTPQTVTPTTVPTVDTPSDGPRPASGALHSGTFTPHPAKRGLRKEGTSPRQEGTNPRARGTSPRQVEATQKRAGLPTALGDVLREALAKGDE